MTNLVPIERVETKILLIRGQKVMLDRDLAALYGVRTKALKQAVKRNLERFPADFMFELNKEEFSNWRSQIVTSNSDKMGLRFRPFAFTEQGIAMLSSVLKSKQAIQVNIMIMRVFTRLKNMIATHKELAQKITELEGRVGRHDVHIAHIIEAIKRLLEPKVEVPVKEEQKKIGFLK